MLEGCSEFAKTVSLIDATDLPAATNAYKKILPASIALTEPTRARAAAKTRCVCAAVKPIVLTGNLAEPEINKKELLNSFLTLENNIDSKIQAKHGQPVNPQPGTQTTTNPPPKQPVKKSGIEDLIDIFRK